MLSARAAIKRIVSALSRRYSAAAAAEKTSHAATQTPGVCSQSLSAPVVSFYRRPLPPHLISFTSAEGKRLFRQSLAEGHAENYFSLVGNFTTQSEPAFCGLGSLAMVLNALEVDPGRRWKGVWRWYSDDNLSCASDVQTIKERGVTFREFACLSRCNGLSVVAKRADLTSKQEFLNDLREVCASGDAHLVVSFDRKTLGQTGDGHFSPIGSYNHQQQAALVLDTARFKYPSYYAPVDLLWESMQPVDQETGLPRGYFILKRNPNAQRHKPLSLCNLTKSLGVSNPKLANLFCRELPKQIAATQPCDLNQVVQLVLNAVPAEFSVLISLNDDKTVVDLAASQQQRKDMAKQRHQDLIHLLNATRHHPLFGIVASTFDASVSATNIALATIFILASPREIYRTLGEGLSTELDTYRDPLRMDGVLREEVQRISDQLSSLMYDYCQCQNRQAALRSLPSVQIQRHACSTVVK